MSPQSVPLHRQICELQNRVQKLEDSKTHDHQQISEVQQRVQRLEEQPPDHACEVKRDELVDVLTEVESLQYTVLCLETAQSVTAE